MPKAALYLLLATALLGPGAGLLPRNTAGPATGAMAEMLLVNGKIITMDAQDSVVQAVAIRDGKILAVGSTEQIRKLAGNGARVLDLHGLTVTPGLIDTHCHFDQTAELYDIALSQVKSIGEVTELVRAKVAQTKPGGWVIGTGWDESKLAELRYIRASDVDPVSPNNPVWLQHTTGHYGGEFVRAAVGKDYSDDEESTCRNHRSRCPWEPHRRAEGRTRDDPGDGSDSTAQP